MSPRFLNWSLTRRGRPSMSLRRPASKGVLEIFRAGAAVVEPGCWTPNCPARKIPAAATSCCLRTSPRLDAACAWRWTLTSKLPLHGGLSPALIPRNRCPAASTVTSLLFPIRTGVPCACSLAIRAPGSASATGRAWVEAPLTPDGSQLPLAVILRTSPALRSTPVSVQV